jgi:hypothetical protein
VIPSFSRVPVDGIITFRNVGSHSASDTASPTLIELRVSTASVEGTGEKEDKATEDLRV